MSKMMMAWLTFCCVVSSCPRTTEPSSWRTGDWPRKAEQATQMRDSRSQEATLRWPPYLPPTRLIASSPTQASIPASVGVAAMMRFPMSIVMAVAIWHFAAGIPALPLPRHPDPPRCPSQGADPAWDVCGVDVAGHDPRACGRCGGFRGVRIGEAAHPGPPLGCHGCEATHPELGGIPISEQETQADPEASPVVNVRSLDGNEERLTLSSCEGGRWLWILSGQPRRQGSRRPSKHEALEAWLTSHGKWLAEGEVARLSTLFSLVSPAFAPTQCASGPCAASTTPAALDPDASITTRLDATQLAATQSAAATLVGGLPSMPDAAGPSPPPAAPSLLAPPPPAAPPVAPLRCPLCTRYEGSSSQGLVQHLARQHAGQQLSDSACMVLKGIERGICPRPSCRCLRTLWSRQCQRCHSIEPTRAASPGDCLPRGEDRRVRPREPAPMPEAYELPADFTERVRMLPCSTCLHIPVQFRERMACVWANTLEDALRGDARQAALEEGRAKLLLSPPPRGTNLRVELARRLDMWYDGLFAELLVRIEEQHRVTAEMRRRQPACASARAAPRRARQLVREGAYSKAVAALTSETVVLPPAEQQRWAAELLPASTSGAAHSVSPAPCTSHPARSEDGDAAARQRQPHDRGRPLRGIRFPAMSAPGPSGMRL